MTTTSQPMNWINSSKLILVSDNQKFLTEAKSNGFKVAALMELRRLPQNSLVFSFTDEAARHTFEIAQLTINKSSVFCAMNVFTPTLENANYSLALILKSNFHAALQSQEAILKMLNTRKRLSIEGNKSRGTLSVQEKAAPFALTTTDIKENYIYSIAEFFEVHYAHMRPEQSCPFNLTGKLKISGILSVLRKKGFDPDEETRKQLEQLSKTIATEKAILNIKNNKIQSFISGKKDYIDLLSHAAGSRGLELTEFAVGVNESLAGLIDYGINSQVNEGIKGLHVAIGDGASGFHIDFLCPDARITAAPYVPTNGDESTA